MKLSQYFTILGTIWIAEGSKFGIFAASVFLALAVFYIYKELK